MDILQDMNHHTKTLFIALCTIGAFVLLQRIAIDLGIEKDDAFYLFFPLATLISAGLGGSVSCLLTGALYFFSYHLFFYVPISNWHEFKRIDIYPTILLIWEMAFILLLNSKLREKERKLIHLNEFLQNVIDSLMSGIAILNVDGIVIATNQTWDKLSLDLFEDDFSCGLGANFLSIARTAFIDDPEIARETSERLNALLSRKSANYECTFPSGVSNHRRWLFLRASRFEWEREVRIVIVIVDVTERALAEEAILTEQKRSAQLDGVLSTIRTLQHEINNPLQALLGNIELVEMSNVPLESSAEERFSRMKEASQRIAGVIQRMSILTKVETIPSPAGKRLWLPESPMDDGL